ncbi:YveK family protein [Planococcus sp. X10-3]|uniref:YveK family protein n=1 Tax=Planococcus sp. X10-3 TaxID=3061240 RepID=UPI003BAF55E6
MKLKKRIIYDRFKKNKYLILLMILLSIISSVIVSRQFDEPVYRASAQILIGGDRESAEEMDKYSIQDEMRFLGTYREIIESPIVLSEVKKSTNTHLSTNEIRDRLTVKFTDNSQVFSISVDLEDYDSAILLTNAIAEVFVSEAGQVMNVNKITILDKAVAEEDGILLSSGPEVSLALAVFSGLSAGLGLAFILPELSTSVNTVEDAEELLKVPVLGGISPMNKVTNTIERNNFLERKQV